MGPSRPNPSGGGALRAISLSFVVDDTSSIDSSSLRDLASQDPSAYMIVFIKVSTKPHPESTDSSPTVPATTPVCKSQHQFGRQPGC